MSADRRVSAMRGRDKRLALALHHEEHTIVYVHGQSDGSLGASGGITGMPSPYPDKVQNEIHTCYACIVYHIAIFHQHVFYLL